MPFSIILIQFFPEMIRFFSLCLNVLIVLRLIQCSIVYKKRCIVSVSFGITNVVVVPVFASSGVRSAKQRRSI